MKPLAQTSQETLGTIIGLIIQVERAHFRTVHDTGANSCAMTVHNTLRVACDLPRLTTDDLPSWDEARKGYFMPPTSRLLTAPAALANGGRV